MESSVTSKFQNINAYNSVIKQDICQMKVKNGITCFQDRGKWKDVAEKAKTFNH